MTIEITVYDARTPADEMLAVILDVYREVNAEAPYFEGPAEVDDFAQSWSGRVGAPGFRLSVAHDGGQVVGYVFGHELGASTRWWEGARTPMGGLVEEWKGRTFAVIEFAVLAPYRRRGIGRGLHDRLLDGVTTERVTLLVRREAAAAPARAAYASWGYQVVGDLQPSEGVPVYHALLLDLSER
jgi:GNAT superfamily N-acetyltransferase